MLEEATTLGIPTLIVRRATERAEAIEAGVAELVSQAEQVFQRVRLLLRDAEACRARDPDRARSSETDGRPSESRRSC